MTIAISACLLGESVRFDGGHKQDHFVTDVLGNYCDFIPFCPEHLAYGTPRPSIHLVHRGDTQSVYNKEQHDVTSPLQKANATELQRLATQSLCGIIFKSKSPSCGLGSAKTYLENGHCEGKGNGLFAQKCQDHYPQLPMEEEGRLTDPWLRENFVMQIFAYHAFETFKATSPDMKDLIQFHTRNKFLLQAKDEGRYRLLGNLVANHDPVPVATVLEQYERTFKESIAQKSSIKRNRNVLEHMAGFFKKALTSGEKATLHEQIDDYAAKILPLITPLSTLHLYAKKYETTYLLHQTFLEPYPKELALRSHLSSGK